MSKFTETKKSAVPTNNAGDADLQVVQAGRKPVADVLREYNTSAAGLTSKQAAGRLETYGPNDLAAHKVSIWKLLWEQVKDPMLILLFVTAVLSFFFDQASSGIVICIILFFSVAIGLFNNWRSERTADSLRERISYNAVTLRDGAAKDVTTAELVPGDVVRLHIGQIVPADIRLISVNDFSCDESILTGEVKPAEKTVDATPGAQNVLSLASCALMGTIVKEGSAVGVVVATGKQAELGHIASRLAVDREETDFQKGLKKYSNFLMRVAIVLTVSILIVNIAIGRNWLTAALFAFSVAIGITPQLLPALVSTSLSAGSRLLAKKKVLVKKLITIEDLGDVDVLVTDKTGTLTQGHISFESSLDVTGRDDAEVLALGAPDSDFEVAADGSVTGSNDLDIALGEKVYANAQAAARASGSACRKVGRSAYRILSSDDFDHVTQIACVVVKDLDATHQGTWLVVKGAPEKVIARCTDVDASPDGETMKILNGLFSKGLRVIAVATRPIDWTEGELGADGKPRELTDADEQGLHLDGYISFLDQPKDDARESLEKLKRLGVAVKIATGDNALVAQTVCSKLGIESGPALTSADFERTGDDELWEAVQHTSIFARVTPEEKARVVELLHKHGKSVAFLGDGVNDAIALHQADVGISVDTATDVAKDAAGVILLDKDLGVIADGIQTGRRIFNNTIKYVMMGTSSNFGNMFSTVGASVLLPFLPMTATQILLNNLIYDIAQMVIPTDNIDEEMAESPTHWDIGFIRRFMIIFGPISSIFDFVTFGLMLWVFHAGVAEFQTAWFVESMCTQTLIVFIIRTRRVPFWESRPSGLLTWFTIGAIIVAAVMPYVPFCDQWFALVPLPWTFFIALAVMCIVYMALCEWAKAWFYRTQDVSNRYNRDPHHDTVDEFEEYGKMVDEDEARKDLKDMKEREEKEARDAKEEDRVADFQA